MFVHVDNLENKIKLAPVNNIGCIAILSYIDFLSYTYTLLKQNDIEVETELARQTTINAR